MSSRAPQGSIAISRETATKVRRTSRRPARSKHLAAAHRAPRPPSAGRLQGSHRGAAPARRVHWAEHDDGPHRAGSHSPRPQPNPHATPRLRTRHSNPRSVLRHRRRVPPRYSHTSRRTWRATRQGPLFRSGWRCRLRLATRPHASSSPRRSRRLAQHVPLPPSLARLAPCVHCVCTACALCAVADPAADQAGAPSQR